MYLWIDIETTGLEPEKDFVMEIAWFVTDDQLVKLTEGKTSMVSHNLSAVTHRLLMNQYVLDMHQASGLYENYIWAHEGQGTMLLSEDIEEQIMESIESVNEYTPAFAKVICEPLAIVTPYDTSVTSNCTDCDTFAEPDCVMFVWNPPTLNILCP